jgi:hypothetical protein
MKGLRGTVAVCLIVLGLLATTGCSDGARSGASPPGTIASSPTPAVVTAGQALLVYVDAIRDPLTTSRFAGLMARYRNAVRRFRPEDASTWPAYERTLRGLSKALCAYTRRLSTSVTPPTALVAIHKTYIDAMAAQAELMRRTADVVKSRNMSIFLGGRLPPGFATLHARIDTMGGFAKAVRAEAQRLDVTVPVYLAPGFM